ncbi:Eukaryotic translation initiation factor [Scale drop disease virus]|uniref:Eukaryotic translation initiation factor n=1 Tax=Scale drop disease virus TaxID=1697349 RepID=A0A0K1L639_9VIRU|nr:ORF_012R [Scale drop disease virus]AKU37427.1 ORF_012R [Scale drop disease virus]QLI60682.1 Eukaryotic translation initiation factor [Scale drop disease virus]QXJ13600.1 ORF012R [Scale drop disease virus]UNH60773.1 Eukaryotic translation initiation factor [Scale drop disease virus]
MREERIKAFFQFVKCAILNNNVNAQEVLAEALRLDVKMFAPLILCELLFDCKICEQIKTYKQCFYLLCENDLQATKYLLKGIEFVIWLYPETLVPQAPLIMKELCDACLITDKQVTKKWLKMFDV